MIKNATIPGTDSRPLLIFIVGPTASGKSEFAVRAAEALLGPLGFLPEILNSDSIQFFSSLEIGAAKPEPALLRRVPHHLVGHVPDGANFTAGDFRRQALSVIDGAAKRGVKVLFCVGGSGFYNQALEKGMYPVPEIPAPVREGVERDLLSRGAAAMHEELLRLDPETARKIQPQDRYRISRSLEILRASESGETLSEMKARFLSEAAVPPFRVLKFGLQPDRHLLRGRVTQRTRRMIEAGLIGEVKGLRAKGLNDWSPMQSVGYREVQAYLDGALPLAELEPLIVTSTMQLAKRQMTWFRRDLQTRWFDAELGILAGLQAVLASTRL